MKRKTENTLFSFKSSEVEQGKVKVMFEVTINKTMWKKWVRWFVAIMISILMTLNFPGVENLIRQQF